MTYITRVNVGSLNCSCLVDAKGKRPLERACACARSIERGHGAVRSAQDAVKHIARVKGSCRDRPCRVEAIDGKNNGALAGACARVRSIKRSDGAVRSAQEAVNYSARVNVASRDRLDGLMLPARVPWPGPVPAPGTSKVVIGTVRSAQETVKHSARVGVASRDRPCRVDAKRGVPWPGPVPAPGASNVVMAPFSSRAGNRESHRRRQRRIL